MLNNRFLIIAVSIILVIALGVGAVLFVFKDKNNESEESETQTEADGISDTGTDNGGLDWNIDHTTGDSVIEFENGSEVFLDKSLVEYLNRMEFGVPAVNKDGNYYLDNGGDIVYDMSEEIYLEDVIDTLISLINHYAEKNYPAETSHQIQRFYVMYYDRLNEYSFNELTSRLSVCFPEEGAVADTLGNRVSDVFGISSSDNCAFVFSPFAVSKIKVEFYNVAPTEVTLSEEAKALCIYDEWCGGNATDHERNLKGWLYNVIAVAQENKFDEERTKVAQMLFAGTFADIEYRADWNGALVKCLSIEEWNYEALKAAVDGEFGISIDHNVPLQDYFEALNNEVI